ncbi:MAG: oxygen-independent coproporphyrinogen oxidase [Myxococcales bacterium]|nr:oxygen-independent coproporphyrinogen oxidase [Myxococcales bacterium]
MFGVYIHFPYCRKRCPYCDFAVHARARIPHDQYAAAVRRELVERAPLYDGRALTSIYFGGGTPGLWRADCVADVIAAVRATFPPALDEVEITVEANPDDLPRAQLDGLRAGGVTRLSLGLQSLSPKHLHTLGRTHGRAEAERAVADARAAGFDRLSLDLMFGMPSQTLTDLEDDLAGVLAMEPDHVSVYNLTVEERTAFGGLQRAGMLVVPDSGVCAEMYERIDARLTTAGFGHYEISSWARPGRRAVHNTLYWTGGEYLGLGCSAHSFRRLPEGGGERFSVARSVDEWLRAPAVATRETLDAAALEREAVWLGLRFLDGIDRAAHRRLHGVDPVEQHAAEIERLRNEGLVEVSLDRLRLTPRGVLFADEVGARFV